MGPWLYIVILGAAVIGYANLRMNPDHGTSAEGVDGIEAALDQFAHDLEQDNRQLISSVAAIKRELEAEMNKINGRIDSIEKRMAISSSADSAKATEPVQQPPIVTQSEVERGESDDDQAIMNRYRDLLAMHRQGKSIDYIARKSGMNKGEVQLIIQLAKQEEQFRDEG